MKAPLDWSRTNGPEVEFCPMVPPDGRSFSFSRRYGNTWDTTTDAEIYWVDASALEEFRPDEPPAPTPRLDPLRVETHRARVGR